MAPLLRVATEHLLRYVFVLARLAFFAQALAMGVAVGFSPLRAVFPVHSRNEARWHDSVGWFITNSVIQCADTDPAACAAAVTDALALGSHPLAPIFATYGGMPARPGMFAISWLDTRRLPPVDDHLQIQYVSAVIETGQEDPTRRSG